MNNYELLTSSLPTLLVSYQEPCEKSIRDFETLNEYKIARIVNKINGFFYIVHGIKDTHHL